MIIAGSGHISAGDYNEEIKVSGSAKINGNVRCTSFTCSGAVSGEGELNCAENLRCAGSMKIEKGVIAKNLQVSGSMKVCGDCIVENEVRVAGSLKSNNIKCSKLTASGSIGTDGGIEAETAKIKGMIDCAGLFNAEEIEIAFTKRGGNSIGSIGGSNIKIYCDDSNSTVNRILLISKLFEKPSARLDVKESIEGDVIFIEKVNAPLVIGRIVEIGENCEIGQVQYSEKIEIHKNAKVEKYEKV